MTDPLRLAELLCARFSHDLSGLLGSLSGVLELATEAAPGGKGGAAEELALASETAAELTDRLRLLRAAWGGVTEPLSVDALRGLAKGLVSGRRLTLDLDGLPAEAALEPVMARLLLNLLLLGAEALPRGGVLALSGDPATQVVACVAGPDAAWPAALAACVGDDGAAWAALEAPRTVQAPVTALIASAAGLRLSFLMGAAKADAGPPPLILSRRAG